MQTTEKERGEIDFSNAEVTKDKVPIRGVYSCCYETFKEMYKIMVRAADEDRWLIEKWSQQDSIT